MNKRGGPSPKPRSTIGFPITINPPPEYKHAFAVVEIAVANPAVQVFPLGALEPPAITALPPKERTFNVAAITNSHASVSAGFVARAGCRQLVDVYGDCSRELLQAV